MEREEVNPEKRGAILDHETQARRIRKGCRRKKSA
jgi:hypothetical protein